MKTDGQEDEKLIIYVCGMANAFMCGYLCIMGCVRAPTRVHSLSPSQTTTRGFVCVEYMIRIRIWYTVRYIRIPLIMYLSTRIFFCFCSCVRLFFYLFYSFYSFAHDAPSSVCEVALTVRWRVSRRFHRNRR